METKQKKIEPVVTPEKVFTRLAKAGTNIGAINMNNSATNPWSTADVDRLESNTEGDFKKAVDASRFFYKKDPLASTVINKMCEIAINDLKFYKNGLTDNELRVFESLRPALKAFSEEMALEYLLSGLVIPEIAYERLNKEQINRLGIKKYPTLYMPTQLWIRDPSTVTINKTALSPYPSYFVEVPPELVYFITHEGRYEDGTVDKELYNNLVTHYPDFVARVLAGERKIKLDNPLIFRRKVVSNTAYPTQFLSAAIEPMKHKRNLRRMDYSIASRVISAILLFRMGSDEFPITEGNSDQLEDLKGQVMWRNTNSKEIERIFQLFSNHTLQVEWVFPPTDALLNDAKYKDINQEIIFALGFPRVLITGESEKSNTSDPQYATMSPVKTMENIRDKILSVIRDIVYNVAKNNSFKTAPLVEFEKLQLSEFSVYVEAMMRLYATGNLSRSSLDEIFGYNFDDELDKRIVEEQEIFDSALTKIETDKAKMLMEANTPEQTNTGVTGTGKPTTQPNGKLQRNVSRVNKTKVDTSKPKDERAEEAEAETEVEEVEANNINITVQMPPMPEQREQVTNVYLPENKATVVENKFEMPAMAEQPAPVILFNPTITTPEPKVDVYTTNNITNPENVVTITTPEPVVNLTNNLILEPEQDTEFTVERDADKKIKGGKIKREKKQAGE